MTSHTKILLIGGTGTISTPICEYLSQDPFVDLYVLNRGHKPLPKGATQIICDFNDTKKMESILEEHTFDIVCNFIIFKEQQALQQLELFKNKVKQYVFISTVATYNHENAIEIDETHEQYNQYSLYGQNKTKCEELFLKAYQEEGFPVTIVRPSQTYGYDRIPLSVKGKSCWSVVDRILNDKPVIVHGDGKSTWHCTHTYDFAYNFNQLLANEKAIGQCYHNINPKIVTWDMIYHDLYRLLGKEPNIIHIPCDLLALSSQYDNKSAFLGDKQYSCLFDMSKIKADIHEFKNEIDITKGLEMYLEYMDEHPELKKTDEEYDKWCDDLIEKYQSFMDSLKGTF